MAEKLKVVDSEPKDFPKWIGKLFWSSNNLEDCSKCLQKLRDSEVDIAIFSGLTRKELLNVTIVVTKPRVSELETIFLKNILTNWIHLLCLNVKFVSKNS